jgi:acyl transferase domain-containing protein
VRFSDALRHLCLYKVIHESGQHDAKSPVVGNILEVGPHSALRGPILTILKSRELEPLKVGYTQTLIKSMDASKTMLEMAGYLFQRGLQVAIDTANFPSGYREKRILTDLPGYAWDHSTTFWHESRTSRSYRFREFPRHDLLGALEPRGNSLEPTWRNYIRVSEIPWIKGHIVDNKIIYPAAGLIIMAVEASRQLTQRNHETRFITGYSFRDISIGKALIIPDDSEGVETIFSLRPYANSAGSSSRIWSEFRVFSYSVNDGWSENCRGLVSVKLVSDVDEVAGEREIKRQEEYYAKAFHEASKHCKTVIESSHFYDSLRMLGYNFTGPFPGINSLTIGNNHAIGTFQIPDYKAGMPGNFEQPHILHPVTLDNCFQTGFAPLFQSGNPQEAYMPTSIQTLFISSAIDARIGTNLQTLASTVVSSHRSYQSDFLVFDTRQERQPVIVGTGFVCTLIHSYSAIKAQERELGVVCHRLRWQADQEFLEADGAAALCATKTPLDLTAEKHEIYNAYADHIIRESLAVLQDRDPVAQHHRSLYKWMKRQAQHPAISPKISTQDLHKRVESYGPVGKMLHRIGKQLPSIIKGDIEPLSVMIEDGLLSSMYLDEGQRSNIQMAEVVSLMVHKTPNIKILEIGAGSGSATISVMKALRSHELQSANRRGVHRYDFTDISPSFFEKAEELLEEWKDVMSFRKLDIETDPLSQGFEEHFYDLIIASNVVHATKTIDGTLGNVRRLLRPGGKLALVEGTTDTLFNHVIFGTLPGWWLGK